MTLALSGSVANHWCPTPMGNTHQTLQYHCDMPLIMKLRFLALLLNGDAPCSRELSYDTSAGHATGRCRQPHVRFEGPGQRATAHLPMAASICRRPTQQKQRSAVQLLATLPPESAPDSDNDGSE
jgi:hypothetical protein